MSDEETIEISPKFWASKIREYAADGRLKQNVWNKEAEDGKHIACLLGTIGPNVGGLGDVPCAALCMPQWLANITPGLFDGLPRDRAVEYALRYADVIDGWCKLTPRAWQRVELGFMVFCTRKTLGYLESVLAKRPDSESRQKSVQITKDVVALLEERAVEVQGPGEAALAADAAYAARAAADAALAADAAYAARAADAAETFDELIRLISEQARLVAE